MINIWEDNEGYCVTELSYKGKKLISTLVGEVDIWDLTQKVCYTSDWEFLEYCMKDGTPYLDKTGVAIMEADFSTRGVGFFRHRDRRVTDYREQ